MVILLIVKPKRSKAPPPPPPSDPNGNLGVARPESDVPDPGPDVVQPNMGIVGRDPGIDFLFEGLPP